MRWCIMCHREAYWEKTASSEFEAETEFRDESNERDEAAERGWWGVHTEDRRRGLVESAEEATDDEREEAPVPTDD